MLEPVRITKYHLYQRLQYNNRRTNKLDIKLNNRTGNNIVIVLDSNGIKVTNRSEWLPHKRNMRKGYLKIHVAVDTKKKRISSHLKSLAKRHVIPAN